MATTSDLVLIVNPYAGSGRGGHYANQSIPPLLSVGDEYGRVLSANCLEDLQEQLIHAFESRPKILAIYGGDGTVQTILAMLFEHWQNGAFPLILPLRGGTMNVLTNDVGTYGQPHKVLRGIMKKLENGQPLRYAYRGILRIEIEPEGRILHGVAFANGVAYECMKEFYSRGGSRTDAIKVVTHLFFYPKYRKRVAGGKDMQIQLNGQPLKPKQFIGSYCSTLQASVLGFQPFLNQIKHPNREFHFLSSSMRIGELLPRFPAVLWCKGRRFLDPERYFDKLVQEVEIESDQGFTLDGELVPLEEKSRIRLRVHALIKIPLPA